MPVVDEHFLIGDRRCSDVVAVLLRSTFPVTFVPEVHECPQLPRTRSWVR
jgi:hypothetical protein